jgi:flavorubredoxin
MVVQLTDEVKWINPCFDMGDQHIHTSVYVLTPEDGPNIAVDSGATEHREQVMAGVEEATDGEGIDKLILTHHDLPHSGNAHQLMDAMGEVEVISPAVIADTNSIPPWGLGSRQLRVAETMDVAGRVIEGVEPPLMDRTHTCWVYAQESGVLFTADGFGNYHDPVDCNATAAGVTDGISVQSIEDFHHDRLPWLRYIIRRKIQPRIEDAIFRDGVKYVAPMHGNPIHVDDFDDYLDKLMDAVENIYESYDPPDVEGVAASDD